MHQQRAEDDGVGRRAGNAEGQGRDEAGADSGVVGGLGGEHTVGLAAAEALRSAGGASRLGVGDTRGGGATGGRKKSANRAEVRGGSRRERVCTRGGDQG